LKTYGKRLFSKDLEGRDVRCNTWLWCHGPNWH
jgi:hypothetical protein